MQQFGSILCVGSMILPKYVTFKTTIGRLTRVPWCFYYLTRSKNHRHIFLSDFMALMLDYMKQFYNQKFYDED